MASGTEKEVEKLELTDEEIERFFSLHPSALQNSDDAKCLMCGQDWDHHNGMACPFPADEKGAHEATDGWGAGYFVRQSDLKFLERPKGSKSALLVFAASVITRIKAIQVEHRDDLSDAVYDSLSQLTEDITEKAVAK